MSTPSHLEAIPLGGLGEFGMNLMVYRWGRECLVVDAGVRFPDEDQYGINAIVPDLSFLDDCGTIHGVVLTHGHDDHVGGIPFLLSKHDLPVYAPAHARQLVSQRLAEYPGFEAATLRPLPEDNEKLTLGPFSLEALAADHSIPQSKMVVLRTPAGTIVHTADFKLAGANGDSSVLERLSRLRSENVLALFSDSTNADRAGTTPAELVAARGLAQQIRGQSGRVLVTCFASHVDRVRALCEIALHSGRRLALVGGALQRQMEIAERLGLLRFPPSLRVAPESAMSLPRHQVLIVASGSQAEPNSSFARIAAQAHGQIAVEAGDCVLHSARIIPGCETNVLRAINGLLQRGVSVITADDAPIHVSGHASSEELRRVLGAVRPGTLVPIHGEQRQLQAHAKLGQAAGIDPHKIVVARSGDVLALSRTEARVVEHLALGPNLLIDRLRTADPLQLRDRRRLAHEGVVVAAIVADFATDRFHVPEIEARGVLGLPEGWTREAKRVIIESLDQIPAAERQDPDSVRWRVTRQLRRHLRRRCDRQPLIVPVFVEPSWESKND